MTSRKHSSQEQSPAPLLFYQNVECELCEREVENLTLHHLVPRQKKGHNGPTAEICSACQKDKDIKDYKDGKDA